MLKTIKILAATLMLMLLLSCYKSPYTGRSQFIIIDKQEELALGSQSADEILRKERVIRSGKQAELVKTIGTRIAEASGRTDYQWEFYLIDQPETENAFCLPGGKVFVYSGITALASTPDELATVIGHEVAHALDRHGAERMSRSIATNLLGSVASIALSIEDPATAAVFDQAYGITSSVGIMLPFSRKQELEADHDGLILMSLAGYNPESAVDFWQKMKRKNNSSQAAWLSTHPPEDTRIAQIQKILPEIKEKYYHPEISLNIKNTNLLKVKYYSMLETVVPVMLASPAPEHSYSRQSLKYTLFY